MVKNVTVLGAGTAGMLTALWSQKYLVGSEVTVIEDRNKGIIGVGESTVPSLISFLRRLDIDPMNFINSVEGTFKNGISFENWNGDGEKYFHGFGGSGKMSDIFDDTSINPVFSHGCGLYYQKQIASKGGNLEEFLYTPKLAYENRVDLESTNYAFQFNTNKVSDYLKSIAKERGIRFVDGIFKCVNQDEEGYIKDIVLANRTIETDFVFDCSGLSRLILGGVYDQKWVSYKKHLPMKCAIPFFLENEKDIKPYTSAIAMKNGWMWKTPLRDRIGCGYVFDSDYITTEEAKEEVEEFLGHGIKVNKVIPFDVGRYDNIWVKNCIGLGLSSSFIEPLESTSIFMTTTCLDRLMHYINNMNSKLGNVETFNEVMEKRYDSVLQFVYLHYVTERNDSEFWKEFNTKNEIPKGLLKKLKLLKNNDLKYDNIERDSLFQIESYMMVGNGLGLIDKNDDESYENLKPTVEEIRIAIDSFMKENSTKHKDLL